MGRRDGKWAGETESGQERGKVGGGNERVSTQKKKWGQSEQQGVRVHVDEGQKEEKQRRVGKKTIKRSVMSVATINRINC